MYIIVKLLNGFAQPLTYKIPAHWHTRDLLYHIVRVPLQKREERAVIIAFSSTKPTASYAIKEALHLEASPVDQHYHLFINQLSSYYALPPEFFYKRARQSLIEKEVSEAKELAFLERTTNCEQITLTQQQQYIVDSLTPHLHTPAYTPALIHGVTGSGKTEVYKRLLQENFLLHKTGLLILPEVSLAVNFMHILRASLPATIPIYGFHSATPAHEKQLLWKALCNNDPLIIIGVHLPIFVPINNLGLIIIDEEHESGFQEKKNPRINTKEAALMRAHIAQIPIVLGSATPSMSSLHNVATRGWKFFELTQRFQGAFPRITRIALMQERKRPQFWISHALYHAIAERLARKEQVLIFLNRRGFSFFVQCPPCGFVFTCSACSVSLTYHEHDILKCHYCDAHQSVPANCPQCKASSTGFLKKGIGTQQVTTILRQLFPHARIDRADADSTRNKKKWSATLDTMYNGELDILVGTQTISKGYHFPRVTLVGIIWADMSVHFPWYNAAETTLQQLIQVAGRAGRASVESDVIVQTLSNHPIFNYLHEADYMKFYSEEITQRQEVSYPPHVRFVEIELRHADSALVEEEALRCVQELQEYALENDWHVRVMGPSEPPVHKIQNIHVRTIYLKATTMNTCAALFKTIQHHKYLSSLTFTPNPLS